MLSSFPILGIADKHLAIFESNEGWIGSLQIHFTVFPFKSAIWIF